VQIIDGGLCRANLQWSALATLMALCYSVSINHVAVSPPRPFFNHVRAIHYNPHSLRGSAWILVQAKQYRRTHCHVRLLTLMHAYFWIGKLKRKLCIFNFIPGLLNVAILLHAAIRAYACRFHTGLCRVVVVLVVVVVVVEVYLLQTSQAATKAERSTVRAALLHHW